MIDYYKMIKRWHPDVNLQDRNLSEIMARQINEAYETLRDPDNRIFHAVSVTLL